MSNGSFLYAATERNNEQGHHHQPKHNPHPPLDREIRYNYSAVNEVLGTFGGKFVEGKGPPIIQTIIAWKKVLRTSCLRDDVHKTKSGTSALLIP